MSSPPALGGASPPRPPSLPSQSGASAGRRPPWLWIGRVTWLATAIAAIGLFAISVPVYVVALQQPCAGPTCLDVQLTSQQVHSLAHAGLSTTVYATAMVALDVLSAVGWCAVAVVLFWRRSNDRMALFSSLTLLAFGLARFPQAPTALAATFPAWWLPVSLMRYLGSVYLSIFFYVFPTGRLVPWWTRWVALAWIVVQMPAFFFPSTGVSSTTWSLPIQFVGFAAFVSSVVVAQVYRYRRISDATQRRQTRWVVLGMGVALALYLALSFGAPLVLSPAALTGAEGHLMIATGTTLGMILIPLTLAIAILRYRLYDVDLLINRLLVYGSLTTVLAALYFGGIIALQTMLRGLVGQQSDLAIVASTLIIAALFHPLRRRVQVWIDRRFYRRRYDAARILDAFGATMRTEVDLSRLSDHLLAVVQETMQPQHTSLWLRAPAPMSSSMSASPDEVQAPAEKRRPSSRERQIAPGAAHMTGDL